MTSAPGFQKHPDYSVQLEPEAEPVEVVDECRAEGSEGDHYVAVGRLVPYKGFDLLIEAFRTMPERRLVVVGGGPDLEGLRKIAPPNVDLVGWQPLPAALAVPNSISASFLSLRRSSSI